MTDDETRRELLLSCCYVIPPPKPDNPEVFDYTVEDGLKIRTCKTCRCSECQSPEDKDWLCYYTGEYSLRVINIYIETGKYPPKCEDCYDQ